MLIRLLISEILDTINFCCELGSVLLSGLGGKKHKVDVCHFWP